MSPRLPLALIVVSLLTAEPRPLAAQTAAGRTFASHSAAFSEGYRMETENQFKRAATYYAAALELSQNDRDRYFASLRLAAVDSQLGRHTEALAALELARKTAPPDRDLPGELGIALAVQRRSGELIAASATLRELRALGPRPHTAARAWQLQLHQADAHLHRAWGDLSGALGFYQQAEPLLEEIVTDYAQIAAFHRERAACHLGLHDLDAAHALARDALSSDLRRVRSSRRRPASDWVKKGDVPTAQSLLLYAETERKREHLDDARELFDAARELAQRLEAPRELAQACFGLSRLALARDDLLSARLNIMGAMLRTQEGAIPDLHIETLAIAGEISMKERDYAQAVAFLTLGIQEVETMRLTATPEDRQQLLALQADHYRWLLETYLRNNQPWEALAASEALKARNLRDALAGRPVALESVADRVSRLRELQQRLPPDIAAVSYANADWTETDPVAFVLTANDLKVVRLSLQMLPELLEFLPKDDVLAAQRKDVDATRYHLGDDITLAGLVAFFRETIYCDRQKMSALFPASVVTGKLLHHVLMAPVLPELGERTRLLVSPSGLLAYVPFDALRELQSGALLVETHSVSLTPSLLTTLELAERAPATYLRPFLGFGGAVYNPESYQQVMASAPQIKTELQAVTAVRSAQAAGARSPYAGWARGPASNLAGTKAEVELLSELLPGSRIVTGRDVAEPHIRAMAARGELAEARVLHFAVHGSAVPTMPDLSCILLSWEGEITADMPPERDGRLQITEFESLKLRAELVTFSACETGLGAIIAGEGVVGLTGSLLKAGADNVLASLWPVSDYSTVYFMRRYYELHLKEGVPSDLAIAQVKRDMIAGKLKGFQHPQFWAPFNLYGGRELVGPH
ncbi:CHAT domain-containing protein [Synoicihabitans lomoniglobus]|uniref:CHAT domain-containing protein n=1 Tax=Synoicihabitans lomoniglobus TaxID=2909285 RepID=A0AAE9ZTA6_9BACT|nr:CHAT domain-containing protein [Opitutaceae bacterium LMO-M01]WED63871.1 CHAT domain-containing protein [Opitutaceae bacterium LMO-M01]